MKRLFGGESSTSRKKHATSPSSVIDLTQDQDDAGVKLEACVHWISDRITYYNPIVTVDCFTRLAAVSVAKEAAKTYPEVMNAADATWVAAALWVCMKLLEVHKPNCHLMAVAARVGKTALVDKERDIMNALDWDLVAVLKRDNLLFTHMA